MIKYEKTLVPLPDRLMVVISGVEVYGYGEWKEEGKKLRYVGTFTFDCILRGRRVDIISGYCKNPYTSMGSSFFKQHLKKKQIKEIEKICSREVKKWYKENLKWRR